MPIKKKKGITEAQLDRVFSQLVRSIYPEICHSCGAKLPKKELQCCHFISRRIRCVRWDLRNCLPGCAKCNLFTPEHIWELGKKINEYYGYDTASDLMTRSKQNTCKVSAFERKQMFDVFTKALTLEPTEELRNNIINMTKLI